LHVFDRIGADEYEQVVFCHDRATGLRAIIAIHSTRLGPALGGCRFYDYANEDDAVEDVLRLARGMTYKSAAAGLDLGGGKSVILGDPAKVKTEALVRAFARYVGALGGRYCTAEDVGTNQADMDLMRRETPYVTGVSPSLGGSGDPSPVTARGLLHAMRAVAEFLDGDTGLAGRRVVVLGVGKVGGSLVRHLVEEGARVTVADVDRAAVQRLVAELGVAAVAVDLAHTVECDIFSPCAMGASLNEHTIPALRCRAVAGAANNQLATEEDVGRLAERGIVYAPDFICNAGGVINIAEELTGYDRARALRNVERIQETTATVLRSAAAEGISTEAAAERVAERRIAAMSGVKLIRPAGT
jgi:leucine dehydrogenase